MRDGQQGHRREPGAECLRQILHLAEVDQVGGSSRAVYRERSEPRQLSGERMAAGLRIDAGSESDEHITWRHERRLGRQQVMQAVGSERGAGAQAEPVAQAGEHGGPDDGHWPGWGVVQRDSDGDADPGVNLPHGLRAERDLLAGPGQAAGRRLRDERRATGQRERDRLKGGAPGAQRCPGPAGGPRSDPPVVLDRSHYRADVVRGGVARYGIPGHAIQSGRGEQVAEAGGEHDGGGEPGHAYGRARDRAAYRYRRPARAAVQGQPHAHAQRDRPGRGQPGGDRAARWLAGFGQPGQRTLGRGPPSRPRRAAHGDDDRAGQADSQDGNVRVDPRARRPDRIFRFQKAPGIASLAGTKSWIMPGVTLKFLITAASVAWGTRVTAAGGRRAKLSRYGSAKTRESGALLQSRSRA